MKNFKIVLSKKENFEFCYKGFLIFINVDRENKILKLKTTVFSEKKFIPFSIRECIERVSYEAGKKKLPSFLEKNEENSSVELVQHIPSSSKMPLFQLIKLFTFVARSWAPILKRLASQDLQNV